MCNDDTLCVFINSFVNKTEVTELIGRRLRIVQPLFALIERAEQRTDQGASRLAQRFAGRPRFVAEKCRRVL
jgi:hypothetical protein